MTATASIVPRLTRAQLLAIRAWTTTNERSRAEYDADPLAASHHDGKVCAACNDRRHGNCGGRAIRDRRLVMCSCWIYNHQDAA